MAVSDTRDINLDVTIRAKTDDAGKASRALGDVDDSAGKAGKSMRGMSADAKLLNGEIQRSTARLKELDQALLRVGNDKEIRQRIRSERSWLSELQKVAKDLGPEFGKAGSEAGRGFLGGLTSSFKGAADTPILGPALIAGLGAVLVQAGPILGAAIGGVVAGGVATGGVIGGIFTAIKDPRVKSAWDQFGDEISESFFSGDAFVDPIRKSLTVLSRDFGKMGLTDSLEKLAPSLQVLAQGIGKGGLQFMEGFNKLVERGGPLINEMAEGLADTGDALGEFLDDVSESEGALDGLEFTFAALNGTIRFLGHTINWLEDQYHSMLGAEQGIAEGFEQMTKTIPPVSHWFGRVADGTRDLQTHSEGAVEGVVAMGDAFAGVTAPAKDLATALREVQDAEDKLRQTALGVWDANIDAAQAMADLQKQVAEGSKGWDLNTEAGRENQKAVEQTIEALRRKKQAELDASDGSVEAQNRINAKYDEELKKVLAIAQALGATKAELEAIAKTYYAKLVVEYQVADLKNMNKADRAQALAFGLKGFASGGTTPAFEPFRVHDGEVMFSNQQHYVATKSQVDTMSRGSSTASQAPVLISFAATGDSLLDAILLHLRKYVRVNGGDVQTALMN